MIKEACANYFHLMRHPLEVNRKRSDKILTVVAYLSCLTLIVPPLVGLVYGVSSLAGRIKQKYELSRTDKQVKNISSAVNLQKNGVSRAASGSISMSVTDEAVPSGGIDSDALPLDDYGKELLALCAKIRETEDLNQKAKAIAQWSKVFLAEIVVTTPGNRKRLAKEGLQFTEKNVITFSEILQSNKDQGKIFKLWMNDSSKNVLQNLTDYNDWVKNNISEDKRDDYAWGFG